MKYIFSILLALSLSITMYAQKDVTTFLGIPVDGYKSEMRQKLIKKGFTPKRHGKDEYFKGEFNGTDVHVYIVTNNNKVYRIMVCDANTQNEANIKIRFNNLVSQFENNKRYSSLDQYSISEDEHISYEMLVNHKNYEAIFYQNPIIEKIDSVAVLSKMREALLQKYTKEQLQNPTEEIQRDIQATTMSIGAELIIKKPVWFKLCESFGEYYITIFYDNEYNRANGEDL